MTGPEHDLLEFIGSTFRSVWALELLLVLKREPRAWSCPDLVATMRASDLVVSKALDELFAAGLISIKGEEASYMPINDSVAAQIDRIEKLYAARPNTVRRVIILSSTSGAAAFADAFRLRKD